MDVGRRSDSSSKSPSNAQREGITAAAGRTAGLSAGSGRAHPPSAIIGKKLGMTRVFTDDGFSRSGDLARLTADGHMVIEGRVKDVVIRGGDKISADEVEGHLVEHPSVAGAGGGQVTIRLVEEAEGVAALSVRDSGIGMDRLREIELLLYRQAEHLDTRQWQAFIDLFTADGIGHSIRGVILFDRLLDQLGTPVF